jgi:hypothetical protein
MSLLFDVFEVAVLLGACFLVNYVTADAKTNWAEGMMMVVFYLMIVSALFTTTQPILIRLGIVVHHCLVLPRTARGASYAFMLERANVIGSAQVFRRAPSLSFNEPGCRWVTKSSRDGRYVDHRRSG